MWLFLLIVMPDCDLLTLHWQDSLSLSVGNCLSNHSRRYQNMQMKGMQNLLPAHTRGCHRFFVFGTLFFRDIFFKICRCPSIIICRFFFKCLFIQCWKELPIHQLGVHIQTQACYVKLIKDTVWTPDDVFSFQSHVNCLLKNWNGSCWTSKARTTVAAAASHILPRHFTVAKRLWHVHPLFFIKKQLTILTSSSFWMHFLVFSFVCFLESTCTKCYSVFLMVCI